MSLSCIALDSDLDFPGMVQNRDRQGAGLPNHFLPVLLSRAAGHRAHSSSETLWTLTQTHPSSFCIPKAP